MPEANAAGVPPHAGDPRRSSRVLDVAALLAAGLLQRSVVEQELTWVLIREACVIVTIAAASGFHRDEQPRCL